MDARSLARVTAIAALAIAAGGCDAGMRVRVQAECADARAGDTLQVFWFDDADDDLFSAPVEEQVRSAAKERDGRTSDGLIQRDWAAAAFDDSGRAAVDLETFHAGALLLPLQDLVLGSRESDPEGLWIRVVLRAAGEVRDFVVRRKDGEPDLVRVTAGKPGPSCGAIEPAPGSGADPRGFRVVLGPGAAEPR